MRPIARKDNIVVQNTRLETLVYDLTLNKAFLLNETSAFVWQNCDGTREVSEISKALAQRNKQPINNDIVWLAIDQLKKENLIENPGELKSGLEGLSRREVIKRIGFGTMIAMPLISVLVAPRAVNAASVACVTLNNPCNINNFQQSNCCSGLRCDQVTASTTIGGCRPCFPTGTSFGGTGASVPACNTLVTKNLCCNPTGTPTLGGACFCP
jgi:hypothetical protein